jgi:hypothetical protein
VWLIGIACIHGQLREAWMIALSTAEIQQPLETQHGLEHFGAVPHGCAEPPLQLAAAHANPPAELFYPAFWKSR